MNQLIKKIKNISILALAMTLSINALAQVIDIDLSASAPDVTVTLDPYIIGSPTYNAVLNPQSPVGDVTWEVISSSINFAGLEMNLNGAAFSTGTRTVTPDGSSEDITFTPSGTAFAGSWDVELEVSDDDETVVVEITIPVVRQAVSIVFALDRSGSMGRAPHGGSGTITRMDILKNAAYLFAIKLLAFNSSGDEIAFTYFNSSIDNPAPGFGNTLSPVEGNFTPITNEIGSLTTGGSTAMGGALLAAKNKLSGSDNRKFILLFTDGEQNRTPMVNNSGTEAGTESLNDVDNSIQIVTIGTGAAATMNPAILLQSIAEMNTGVSPPSDGTPRNFLLQEEVNSAGDGSDFNTFTGIANFFDDGFQSMLEGGSPQAVGIRRGTIYESGITTDSFIINKNITTIFFEIITTESEPVFTIEKDGISIERYLEVQYGTPNNEINTLLIPVDLEREAMAGITSEGQWKINLSSGTGSISPYQVKVQVDDHLLDYGLAINAEDFKVADTLMFEANLAYRGVPITDGNIALLVLKPGDDLGDLLAKANINFDPSRDAEAGSIGYQKLLAAIENNPELLAALSLQENIVNLSHTNEGKYIGKFADTGVSGVYQIVGQITGNTVLSGTFNRQFNRTVYLRFGNPEPEVSEQVYIPPTTEKKHQLIYKPSYNVGNQQRLVGPGFGNGIKLNGTNIKSPFVTDNGDGSYTIEFTADASNPNINLSIAGVDIYAGRASEFGGKDSIIDKIIDWWKTTTGLPFWVLILLVLIIIIIIIRRQNQP